MTDNGASIDAEAADWVVRAVGGDIGEAEIATLTAWMGTSPRHAQAYRRALAVWAGLDDVAGESAAVIPLRRPVSAPRRYVLWGASAAALCAAALAVMVMLPAPETVYATAKGQRRDVTLADGSHLMLNTDTRLRVRLAGSHRDVTLDRGEVALTVTHDEQRPFVVKTGKVTVTDLGTQFNVSRLDGVVRVAVREGVVSLAAPGQSATTLRAGDFGLNAESTGRQTMGHADPGEAFAWTTAHAIYRQQPLSVVVHDLNRYYDKPIIVDDAAGAQRLSTILTLDSQDAVVGRLREFLPLEVRTTHEAIYLSLRTDRAAAASGGNGR